MKVLKSYLLALAIGLVVYAVVGLPAAAGIVLGVNGHFGAVNQPEQGIVICILAAVIDLLVVFLVPEIYLAAFAVSFAAFCGAGVLALIVVFLIPASHLADQMRFYQLNPENPAVYTSQLYKSQAPTVALWDFWATVPVTLVAGAALGACLASRPRMVGPILAAIVSSLILVALTFGVGLAGSFNIGTSTGPGGPHLNTLGKHFWLQAAGGATLWIAAYLAGAIAAYLGRRRTIANSTSAAGSTGSKKVARALR